MKAHRIIFALIFGYWPTAEIDHENGVRTDNRLINLRKASRAQNAQNRKKSSNNTSGFPGVTWNKRVRKWQAQICIDKRFTYLGCFNDPKDAYAVYLKAKVTLHPFQPEPRE